MKIALAQINPTVGDITGNSQTIIEFASRAAASGAQLVVFPEMSVIGYPAKDLLLQPKFIDEQRRAVDVIARQIPQTIHAIIGYAERNAHPVGRPLHNAVAVLHGGAVISRHFKTLLPTYDVFDESRYFEPGPVSERNQLVRIGQTTVGISICEDLWNDEKLIGRRLYHQNPLADLHAAGAEVMVNASASPFVLGKQDFRLKLFSAQARAVGKPLVVVNQVGGNDELVFDGNSVAFDAQGNAIATAKDFEDDLVIVDLPLRGLGVSPDPKDSLIRLGRDAQATKDAGLESIYKALVLGLRDYVRKCGFKSVVLGLSGGIDSALTAALAVDALGNDKVVGVAMPSRFSSDHSIKDARDLAQNLDIAFHVVPIKELHDCYESALAKPFEGLDRDVTEENLQARIRGAILMAFSNKFNHLLLSTGNKSELAVGYCTLYGDMCGGLALISDVPKTMVWELSRWINAQAGTDRIPRNSIEKVPSAELRPDQTDQDSLPPYEVLDAILFRYIEEEKSAGEIIQQGYDPQTVMRVIRLVDRSEYKRRQAAPGIKVTSRAFGFGRRMPIAQGYTHLLPAHGEPSPTLEEQLTPPAEGTGSATPAES